MPDNPLERSQLVVARYWKPLASLASLLAAAIAALPYISSLLGLSLEAVPGQRWPWSLRALVVAGGVLVFAFVRSPRVAAVITRLILGAPRAATEAGFIFRGPRPYVEADNLPDRRADLEECWLKLQDKPVFILEGESGCGKSSLWSAGLIPRARGRFRVISVRAGEGPIEKLYTAVSPRPPESGSTVDPEELVRVLAAEAALDVARGPSEDRASQKPLLVCLDQAEELFTSVRENVRQQFAALLKRAVAAGHLSLVVIIRSDFRDLLDKLLRSVDPDLRTFSLTNDFVLWPFSRPLAEDVLGELLQPVHGGDPLLREQLERFSRDLVQELLRPPRDRRIHQGDERTVLPVELQIVGYVIQRLGSGYFTGSKLAVLGGKAGLFRRYIDDVTRDVMRLTGVEPERTLAVLRVLAPEGSARALAQRAEDIGPAVALPVDLVVKVLDVLARHYIVNQLPGEPAASGVDADDAGSRYELMHDHLAVILKETPDRRVQRAREHEERLKFWMERSEAATRLRGPRTAPWLLPRLRSRFAQPVPIVETLRLWRSARGEGRRLLRRNLFAFVLRIAVFVLLPLGALAALLSTDSAQIGFMTATATTADAAYVVGFPDEELDPGNLAVAWVRALVRADMLREADQASRKIKPRGVRAEAIVALADGLAPAGRADEVLTSLHAVFERDASEAADKEERAFELLTKARALAGVGRVFERAGRPDLAGRSFAEALAAVEEALTAQIPDAAPRAVAFAEAARVSAKAGQPAASRRAASESLAIIPKVEDASRRGVLAALLDAFIEAGLDDAIAQAAPEFRAAPERDLRNASQRAGYLTGRVRGLVDAVQRASPATRESMVIKREVQQAVADAIAAARDLREEDRMPALLDGAHAWAVLGDQAQATALAEKALLVARGATNPIRRGKMVAVVVRSVVWPGLAEVDRQATDEALSSAPATADPATRGLLFAAAASRMAAMGRLDAARRAASAAADLVGRVTEEQDVCVASLDMARAYARLGKPWRAQFALARCRFNDFRMAGYISILNSHTDARKIVPRWWWWK